MLANFKASIYDHTGKTLKWVVTDFMDMDLWNRLSEWAVWSFCIKCDSPDLQPLKLWIQDFDPWLEVCNFVRIQCCDEFWWEWYRDGFIWEVEDLLDRSDCVEKVCVEMIDCIERLKYRQINREIDCPQAQTVEDIIAEIRNEVNDECTLDPLILGTIKAPIELPDEHGDEEWITRARCTTLYEILQDLAERTGGEFRFCATVDEDGCPKCELQFSVPDEDDCPYGTWVLLDGTYIYNALDTWASNVRGYSIKNSNKWYCNSKRSKTAWSDTEYCLIENEDEIERCWKYECCEDDPQWHDVTDESTREPMVEVTIDWSCEPYCNIKVWDRKEAKINTCRCKLIERQIIILEKHIRCTENLIEVDYETSTINALRTRRTTQRTIINDIYKRIRKWELY